jgi:hypothetical protein
MFYAFLMLVGTLGGRIAGAAWLYTQLGWTATWLEIGTWGPSLQPDRVSTPLPGGEI